MPTILNTEIYRFFFFSLEDDVPPHVYVEQNDKVAKFYLKPINLVSSYGFRSYELTAIRALVFEYNAVFLEKWHEFFNNKI